MNDCGFECQIFAEDLIDFIRFQLSSPSSIPLTAKTLRNASPLTNSVRIVVLHHIQQLSIEVKNIFNSLLEHGDLNVHFPHFAQDMVKVICLRGFRENELLQFCTILSMLAVLCHNSDFKQCMEHAVNAIVDVLIYFQITGEFAVDGWHKLAKASLSS